MQVFPGFPAAEVLFDESGAVMGVATQDMGVAADGSHKPDYQPGMELHAKYTLFAEGARGHLTKRMKAHFDLEADCQPQIYGLGIKELWDIDPDKHVPGRVIHTQGWPLSESDSLGRRLPLPPGQRPGRARLRHRARLRQPLRLPVRGIPALEAAPGDPRSPRRRQARRLWRAGDQRGRLAVGAASWRSRAARWSAARPGFVNVPRIKGTHTAMKSGMLAAEAVAAAIAAGREQDALSEYDSALRTSWIAKRTEAGQERPAAGRQVRRRRSARCLPASTCGCAR